MLILLFCNLAYLCAYLVATHRRLIRKTKGFLLAFGRTRAKRDGSLDEMMALKKLLSDMEVELEYLKSRLRDSELEAAAGRMALALVQDGLPALAPGTDIDSPALEDRVYELKTKARIGRYPYGEIAGFTIAEGVISLHLLNGESVITDEESLVSIIRTTDGYFRNTCREEIIAQHRIAECFSRPKGKLELVLKDNGGTRLVSKAYADAMQDWVLDAVKEIRIKTNQ